MALKQLTPEQIRDWSLEQKDRWWRDNVWRGNMPQLTLRSAATGMMLGGILSLTNLYVGAKTGWTLGVGLTSVVLAFALFKVLARIGLGHEFTVLENNAMQSIATAAGYMTTPLISSLAAYMLVTHSVLPIGLTMAWMVSIAGLGVLFAFPLKRRFINDEQLPFPEGRAAGIVMDALHDGDAADGMLKARLLVVAAAVAAVLKLCQSAVLLERLKLSVLLIPDYLDEWVYRWVVPAVHGVSFKELTVRLDSDFVLMAAGGLTGIRTGVALLVGGILNYLVVVPIFIARGDITGHTVAGITHFGFREITRWALWGGVAMMTTSSLFAFFARPQVLIGAFRGLFRRGKAGPQDVLKDIELPFKVFVIGIPLVGAVVVLLTRLLFGVDPWLSALAIPLIFVFTLIAVNSTALTSITPTSALGQLTQLTFGALAPGNVATNLATAGITSEVAANASNLLMDIKPGYMLGAKPRQQAVGHVLGIVAGALVAVPIFYLAFLRGDPANLISPEYPLPSATVWRAVAELLTQGAGNLPVSARWAALYGGLAGIVLTAVRVATKGRFWLSGVGLGLAAIVPFNTCLSMFLGSFVFWLAGRIWRQEDSRVNRIVVQNQEPICAGVIAGGAVMGIAVILIEQFVLAPGK